MSINQFIRILWARRFIILIAFLSTVVTAVAVTSVLPKRYSASAKVLVPVGEADPVTGAVTGATNRGYLNTLTALIQSERVALRVVDRLELTRAPQYIARFEEEQGGRGDMRSWIAKEIMGGVRPILIFGSNIIMVEYTWNNPQAAALFANAFAEAFIDVELDLKVQSARQGAAWYNDQIADLREELEEAQQRLADYQQETGILLRGGQLDSDALDTELSILSESLAAARADLVQTETILSRLEIDWPEDVSGSDLPSVPDYITNGSIEQKRAEIANIDTQLATLSQSVGPSHPQYQGLRAARRIIVQQLDDEMENLRQSIATRATAAAEHVQRLEQAYEDQKLQVLGQERSRDRLGVLMREVQVREEELQAATRRAGQLRLRGEASNSGAIVLEEATAPGGPSFPRPKLNLALGIAFGGALGFGLALLAEMLDRRVRSWEDLFHSGGTQVMGIVPDRRGRAARTRRRRSRPAPDGVGKPAGLLPEPEAARGTS